MSVQEVALQKVNEILADPKYHDILAILKGFRNGLVYGVKVCLDAAIQRYLARPSNSLYPAIWIVH
jgi:peroxisomal membrane protein 4